MSERRRRRGYYPTPVKRGQVVPSADKVVGGKQIFRVFLPAATGDSTGFVELPGICRLYGASLKSFEAEVFEPATIRLYPPGNAARGWERAHETLAAGEVQEFQYLTWSGERYVDANWFVVGRAFRDPENVEQIALDVMFERLWQGYGDQG